MYHKVQILYALSLSGTKWVKPWPNLIQDNGGTFLKPTKQSEFFRWHNAAVCRRFECILHCKQSRSLCDITYRDPTLVGTMLEKQFS